MRLTLMFLAVQLCASASAAADGGELAADSATQDRSFGRVQQAGGEHPIRWEPSPEVEFSQRTLRFSRAGSVLRSELLPLTPLVLYRVTAMIARGPGAVPRFAITYVDARGKTVEWVPNWQHKHATHANWLPLSPRAQRYVQGFVLPQGASEARLTLQLGVGDKALAKYSHWTLRELRFDALAQVTCCERAGEDLLLNGAFDAASNDGLPQWWGQWGMSPENRVELRDDPARKRVLRIKPATSVQLASRYLVPVTPGRAYKLSLLARGQGKIELDVHTLSRDRPTPLSVGNGTRGLDSFAVQAADWQLVSTVWFAEAPNAALANVVIAISAHSAVEIDSVELRPFE